VNLPAYNGKGFWDWFVRFLLARLPARRCTFFGYFYASKAQTHSQAAKRR